MERLRTIIEIERRLSRAIERLSAGLSIRQVEGRGVLVRAFACPPSDDRPPNAR